MNKETRTRIDKRIKEIKQNKKTYICFEHRYLLEGKDIALVRYNEQVEYYGERVTDYGATPSPYILINTSAHSSSLESLFTENKISGWEE